MKNGLYKIVPLLLLCSTFIIFPAQKVNAQVSAEAARLLNNARIQVLNQRVDSRDFTLPLLDGSAAALSSYRGNVVILNFWATWCPPCRSEMPSMETLYKRFKDQGLEILAVDIGENLNTVRQFIKTNNYTFPVMLDSKSQISGIYGIEAIPATFIIDREGKIIGRVTGSIHWDTAQVFSAFEALLKSR
ncbi:MAG: TlpA family protein disulfide reductase [Treponema sp.]|jgi:peroxiredoxin|nr:TlpA family protein disulfide reductase [Treponema sp.]